MNSVEMLRQIYERGGARFYPSLSKVCCVIHTDLHPVMIRAYGDTLDDALREAWTKLERELRDEPSGDTLDSTGAADRTPSVAEAPSVNMAGY
jgi:hypothetical protein